MDSNSTDLRVEAAIFIGVTSVLSLAAIVSNVLLLSVIIAAEKIGSNVANLVFLCIPHMELAILVLIHRAITYNAKTADSLENGCVNDLLVRCLERGSILWSISGITSLTVFQYLHIEKPFWYEAHVSPRLLVMSSLIAGTVCHLIGLLPFMQPNSTELTCEKTVLESVAYIIFAVLVIVHLGIIIGLSGKMFALAEKHRQRMKEYKSMQTSRADSMRFLIILIVTYIMSHIVPVVAELIQLGSQDMLPYVMQMDIFHLLAALIFAILYGTRTPQGFGRSIRMAICCCLPVKPTQKPLEIDDVVRLTMMRLGNVMVKIDETAASKRHSSFLKKKSQIMKSFSFLKPSDNDHKQVRPCKSLDPAMYRHTSSDDQKQKANRAVSLNIADNEHRHERANRLLSWLPKKSGAKKFDVTQKTSEAGLTGMKNAPSTMVTLTALNMPRKLSNISETSFNVDMPDNENNTKLTAEHTTSKTGIQEAASTENVDIVIENADVDLSSENDSSKLNSNNDNVKLTIEIEDIENSFSIDGTSIRSTSPCLKHTPLHKTDSILP